MFRGTFNINVRKNSRGRFFAVFVSAILLLSVIFSRTGFAENTSAKERSDDKSSEYAEKNADKINIDISNIDTVPVETSGENMPDLGLTAKSAVLMEASTGKIIYSKNQDQKLSPASITKIMTLILIFDAIESGKISLEDNVTTSAYAKSMGGSQVFLEEGEVQTVETLIKCIIIASGNDASVAMAEYLCGSEAEFVAKMNERAKSLGMNNTNFEDCCGLTDSDNHYVSAMDVAIMSRELIVKYPKVFEYSGIWMENIVHNTKRGSSEFTLANTNKLLKQYAGTTGLKTGSTSKAKYCLSATARRKDIDLIAVVMASENYKLRFSEAITLLNYGYANCELYKDETPEELHDISVSRGITDKLKCEYAGKFSYLALENEKISDITKEIIYNSNITAPVAKGDVVGYVSYMLGERELGRIDIVASHGIKRAGFTDCMKKVIGGLWL